MSIRRYKAKVVAILVISFSLCLSSKKRTNARPEDRETGEHGEQVLLPLTLDAHAKQDTIKQYSNSQVTDIKIK